jgi:MFS family permease
VYFIFFYAGCTGFPPLAGWFADRFGSAAAPVLLAAALLVAALALFALFRREVARG